jgi:hypothetical protein
MQWFFETIAGNTSTRCLFADNIDFDAINHRNDPETVDFLLRFTGLDYTIVKNDMPVKSAKSIDNGWPVLARMKKNKPNGFRVITGYGDNFNEIITAGTDGENGRPDGPPAWEEISEIIVVKEKTQPKAGIIDAFRRISAVIEGNVKKGGVWDTCIQGFDFRGGVNIGIDELEHRFSIMRGAAFYNFNSHFFAEQFRIPVYEGLKDSRLEDIRHRIDCTCDTAHMRNWEMVALYDFRGGWSKMNDNVKEWGYATSMLDCIKVLKSCDEEILAAINDGIKILES